MFVLTYVVIMMNCYRINICCIAIYIYVVLIQGCPIYTEDDVVTKITQKKKV